MTASDNPRLQMVHLQLAGLAEDSNSHALAWPKTLLLFFQRFAFRRQTSGVFISCFGGLTLHELRRRPQEWIGGLRIFIGLPCCFFFHGGQI
mmetsp:Transcript_121858/g.289764  ORF Transcript_121858/g.289764 Transcript_121858/m.289764 type:complete len:92 (+) Transcript_121858:168-443(+)